MAGFKVWAADDILTAADMNSYLMTQVVTVWANSGTRASGILSPNTGALSYLQDTNLYYRWNGSAWVELTVTNATNATYATTAGTASNASKVSNQTVFIQSGTPTPIATNDLWFW